MPKLKDIAQQIEQQEMELLSEYAAKNESAYRPAEEEAHPYRPPFALDRDRIFYSGAFRRYTGKTQVIYFVSLLDEQLTSRILHTLSVAQISKTIGRMLGLNNDLIESIALGHDLGHPPFGHDGEVFLSKISEKYGVGQFHHNIQSLRVVDSIAKKGHGLNLTFQTRDGILSHNGERHDQILEPVADKTEKDLQQYIERMEKGETYDMLPATLEGCVVRLTDTIAYIGQDIEDAIRIGLIKRSELPETAAQMLGRYNGEIIESLVNDVVQNSHGKPYVSFSETIAGALYELKQFNYRAIYKSSKLKVNHERIERGFEILFAYFLDALNNKDVDSAIYQHFLISKSARYVDNSPNELIVRDFIAGMTDRYFSHLLNEIIIPQSAGFRIQNE